MKKVLYIMMLLAAAPCCFAQQNAPQASNDCYGWLPGYPAHYCECRETSQEFHFPLEQQLTDTMWFSSTVNDLKQGLSAYWFANSSITFEVYAFCSSKTPTITMTVGANQMREMDVATINRKLEEMGDMAELMAQTLTPRIKVYPNNGGSGTVYCYPYDQGPLSTCEDSLPLIPRMTYVCSDTTEVYELKPSRISKNGEGFIRWKQKDNKPGTIRLTTDSCNGPEIANETLMDSTHVLVLDADTMSAIKKAGKSVFVHVTHEPGYVGRMFYHNRVVWTESIVDTTICQGMGLQLGDTILMEETIYPNDTNWIGSDTLSRTTFYVGVEVPIVKYDTLRLRAAELPKTYLNYYIPKNGWGDHEFYIRHNNLCDDHYLVHVVHIVDSITQDLHDTLCVGRSISYSGIAYTTDTTFRDSAWIDADTWAIRDISIHFTEPEMEYDTVLVKPSEMENGYWDSNLKIMLYAYGDTVVTITKKNTCTRLVQVTVQEAEEDQEDIILVPGEKAAACKYLRDGMLYIRREGREYDLMGRPSRQ